MKQLPAMLLAAACLAIISGCSGQSPTVRQYQKEFESDPPTTQWLEDNVNEFREKAWAEPTKDNVTVFAFMKELLDERKNEEARYINWHQQTHRLLTVDWLTESRGGAAYRKAAYEHVLADGQPKLLAKAPEPLSDIKGERVPGLTMGTFAQKNKPAASDNLTAWMRYCNKGEGMTKADWQVVLDEGIDKMPAHLKDSCIPPK